MLENEYCDTCGFILNLISYVRLLKVGKEIVYEESYVTCMKILGLSCSTVLHCLTFLKHFQENYDIRPTIISNRCLQLTLPRTDWP